MSVRLRNVIIGGLLALTMVVAQAVPAGAVARSQQPALSGTNTQMTLSGLGPGQGVTGFIADSTNPFDPVLDGYPSTDPTTGFTPKDEGFAGVIFGQPTDGGPTLSLYCFDILTDTWVGIGYALGTWDAANVPNVGFVAQVLNNYYPFVPSQPGGLANTSQQAAAVQAAIWFFSDRYVLSTSDPLYNTVVQIVNHVLSLGPVTQPPPPNLSITPTDASGPNTGAVVGPFTVNSSTGAATVTATGAQMFSDSGATSPIANGTSVTTPAQIWLRSTGPTSAVLQATAIAAIPKDNVYLYDGNTPGVNDAQRLILAQDATLTTTVTATAEFKSVGSLVVQKTVAGAAAGSQSQVTIHSVCGGAALTPDFIIPSGTPAGTSSRTYTNIPSGSMCTVTETVDGNTSTVLVNVVGNGQQVTVPENSSVTVAITDMYTFLPGSLTVVKAITGDGAGQQGEVIIHVSCPGVDPSLTPDFVIPAGTAAGSLSTSYNNLPANTTCTVSETANGANSVVSVVTTGGGAVTIPIGRATEANITNDYSLNAGSLVVTKTIAGGAAGSQGAVTIAVECTDGVARPDFVIPVGTTAGSTSMTYADIPANTVCRATETANGSTSTTAVEVTGDNGTPTTIPAGGTATAAITDTYTDISGTLVVNKEITGDGAGLQGEVTIHVDCNDDITRPDFTIAAGGTSNSTEYTGIAPGTECTVTETADGSIAGVVTVVTSIAPTQPVTISASGSVEVDVVDTYTPATGSLTVTKNIAGPAAGQQGAVTIQVLCVGVDPSATPPFVIPAGSTGTTSHTYTDLPDQAKCLVAETVDASTSTVSVTVSALLQTATIVADQTATVAVTDTYSLTPGGIVVAKFLAGPFAGQQGPITIDATCGGSPLPTFAIPAGTPAGLQLHFYDDIPAGSTCTLTETADGATSIVTTTVLGGDTQTVTVAAGTVVPAVFADIFTDSPGTLTVTKNIAGAAAGREGPIAILVDCGQPSDQFAFLIPAGTPAGTVSRSFDGIPANSTCTITETSNGATSTVAATVTGSGQQVSVAANQVATAVLTDTYSPIATLTAQLAFTGAGPALTLLAILGIAAIGTGGLFAVLGRRPRHRRRGPCSIEG
jgi:Domain of unknown function (DUF5979)/Thioester domain